MTKYTARTADGDTHSTHTSYRDAVDQADMIHGYVTLVAGQQYDTDTIELIGWTDGDGSGSDDYSVWDYSTTDGIYRGADEYGIEPIVEIDD